MCWNGYASATIAGIGFALAAYERYKKEPIEISICITYFFFMELLQALTYTVIGQCANPLNQMLTYLSLLHIAFQPFAINALAMFLIPKEVKEKIQWYVYTICFICALIYILLLYPYPSVHTLCQPGIHRLCGPHLCAYRGNWHIAWSIPRRVFSIFGTPIESICTVTGISVAYFTAGIVLPIIYGSWRWGIYHILVGPVLAFYLTNDINEIAAIWCLFSLGIAGIFVIKPIRRSFMVKRWPLWRLIGFKPV